MSSPAAPPDPGDPAIGERLRFHHLLLVDAAVVDSDIEVLLSNLLPVRETTGLTRRISRYSSLTGPLEITDDIAGAVGIPAHFTRAYALASPRERESAPPPPWFKHVAGLEAFFPAGLPEREEERGLELLTALARRLHAAIRVAEEPPVADGIRIEIGTGVPAERIVTPDPETFPDLVVYSQYWLDPDVLHGLVQAAVPDTSIPHPLAPEPAAADAAADAEEVVLDGYGLAVELGGRGGTVEVAVMVETELPYAVTRFADGPQVAYSVRWHCGDEITGEITVDDEYRSLRRAAAGIIDDVAAGIVSGIGGIVLDHDGFLVTAHQLDR